MAYETGYAANEFELQEKLNAFILSIDGWTKISQPGDFESVYFSSGEDNYKDIYLKTIAGLTENPAYYGGNQRDFGDGYVGFLNFFVYQYYPEGGDGYDGYGEAGKLGPFLYQLRGYNDYDIMMQRISTASAAIRNKWNRLGRTYTRSNGEVADFYEFAFYPTDATFDGKRYFYFWSSDYPGTFFRWDLAGEFVETLIKGVHISDNFVGLVYYIDPQTRKEYVWYCKDDAVAGDRDDGTQDPYDRSNQLKRWNVEDGVLEFGFSGPPWPDTGDRESYAASIIWDGHNHLYLMRGSGENDWAKYHIPTDTWTLLVDLPVNHADSDSMIWLDKKTSGFNYHRIYWSSDTANTIYYVNIDENSGMPVGSWTSAGATPESASRSNCIFHNHTNRWYWHRGEDSDSLWYAPMDSGSLSWTLLDADYAYTPDRNFTFAYVDGYASRVRTSLFDRTQYWFFGNADRITVVTKADDQYTYCYMGAIEPYTLTMPHAITTAPVYAGANVEIPIQVLKGEFENNQRLFISDITDYGGAGSIIGEVENISRKFKPTEMITTTHVTPDTDITVSELKNNYPAGSRIAFDPQPVGITLGGLDKIQMLNSINTVDSAGSYDMAENIANLDTVRDTIINASAGDDRRGAYGLWPILVLNDGVMAAYSGEELRGSLVGIFAISSQGDISPGDTISAGTNTYVVLDVPTSKDFYYVFGPLEDEED